MPMNLLLDSWMPLITATVLVLIAVYWTHRIQDRSPAWIGHWILGFLGTFWRSFQQGIPIVLAAAALILLTVFFVWWANLANPTIP